jgi:exopolyphosphatase/guanosine-5'-triphosphate,3'-diphosphate pyrophosphatase
MSPVKASIDLGTNTARLLIAKLVDGKIIPLALERRITRLGGGFCKTAGISPEAWSRSLSALEEFAAIMSRHRVTEVAAVATSAVRDAVNGAAFANDILERTGIRLTVIDGDREGKLTLRGILSVIPDPSSPVLAFDVGGGSTEYTLYQPDAPLFVRSTPLGVVRLTEGKGTIGAMQEKIDRELFRLQHDLAAAGLLEVVSRSALVGTAGTATTLAAMDLGMVRYDPARINNHSLPLPRVRQLLEMLAPLPSDQRLMIPGMEKGREDLIIAGMLITLRTMEILAIPSMAVSDSGLLEGLLLGE